MRPDPESGKVFTFPLPARTVRRRRIVHTLRLLVPFFISVLVLLVMMYFYVRLGGQPDCEPNLNC